MWAGSSARSRVLTLCEDPATEGLRVLLISDGQAESITESDGEG